VFDMPLFKRKLSEIFKWEKALKGEEREALHKYFGEQMIHAYVTTPQGKEMELKKTFDLIKKRDPPKTPEEEKYLKQAIGTSFREHWNPFMTYGAFKAISSTFGKEKFDEKLRDAYNRARANKRELVDEVMLDFCTPQERETSINEAKEYGLPIWEVADLNSNFKNIDNDLKKEIYSIAKKGDMVPRDVIKMLVEKRKKLQK
jgi:hypothetical protein